MREFAESELVLPDGPFKGQRFKTSRQPFAALWFDAFESGQFERYAAVGPTQTGKTLMCAIIPLLYFLFELDETTIFGVPHMLMARDKWERDIKPVLEKTRYIDLMPSRGGGSRGGSVETINFENGAALRFMSGGGDDQTVAGFTARCLVATEVDGLAKSKKRSAETIRIKQLEARTRAYPETRQIFLECTASTEVGQIWKNYTSGTESRIVIRCPKCRGFVSPEREHLTGWQVAEDEETARELARFECPSCSKPWSESERHEMLEDSRLLHDGETIGKRGGISGTRKRTRTLGFRWNSFHSRFTSAGALGAQEYLARADDDEENAEKEMRQFVWSRPWKPAIEEIVPLDIAAVYDRSCKPGRGIVPNWCERLTAAVDCGKYICHWVVVGWALDGTSHVVDYGVEDVPSSDLGIERGLLVALRSLRDWLELGFAVAGATEGTRMIPDQVWVDCGWKPGPIYEFCREAAKDSGQGSYERFRPSRGRGRSQSRRERYRGPTRTTGSRVLAGAEGANYHGVILENERIGEVQVSSDHWKTWVHGRLSVPPGKDGKYPRGAMTIFEAPHRVEHTSFAKHLTSEREVEEFDPAVGTVTRWEKRREANHWFDALYNAAAAGHLCGVRLLSSKPEEG